VTGSWRTISVALEAKVGGYINDLNRASAATRQFGRDVENDSKRATSSIRDFATGAGKLVGITSGIVAVAAAFKFSVGQAIAWESAFAGVIKTVDGTESQLAALEAGIISMANRIPATREEIASVAEAAGQLGIATPNILSFTETMIGLGEATNLSATDAATQLARLANITQMSQQDFDRLGASVVALGNNFATTEAEIVAMSLRIASAGKQVGLSEAEITGLAAALSSVGIDAEAGGSAISRVMIDIATAVDEGGDKLAKIAEVAGMTADQFANIFREDSAAALTAFVEGLGTAESRGMSLFAVMEELGFADIRVGNALRSLAGAGELLGDALGVSTTAFEENVALTDEVSKRYATAESQLRTFGNQITNVARLAGAALIPALLGIVEGIRDVAKWAADMAKELGDSGTWDNIVSTGENLAEILVAIFEAGMPVAKLFAGIGLALAGLGLDVIADVLAGVTGLMADLAPVIQAAAIGWAAYAVASNASAIAAGLHSAAMGVQLRAMYALEAAQKRLQLSTVGAAGAVGALVGAGAMWYAQIQQWKQAGADRADTFFDKLDEGAENTVESLRERARVAEELAIGLDRSLSRGIRGATIDFDFNTETKASRDEALEQAETYRLAANRIADASEIVGLSQKRLNAVLRELEIDPLTASTLQMAAAIQQWAVDNNAATPSAAAAAGAIEEENQAMLDGIDAIMQRYDAEQAVASAQRAYVDAQDAVSDAHREVAASQRAVTDAARGVEQAQRGVADAARGVADAQRGVADAQRSAAEAGQALADAQRDALYGTKELEQANRGVTEAEQALAQAQRDSLTAQQELDVARGLAVRNLDDLGRAAESAAISEERAVLALEEARKRLAAPAEEGDDATDAARKKLDVRAAELALEEARVRNADAQAALAEAESKGIEQSDAVTAAKENITEAAKNEKDAEEALSEARERVVEIQEGLTARVEEAQRRVEEANRRVEESQYRLEQAAMRVRDAQDQVGAAQQRLVEARQGVEDAMRGVSEAEAAVEQAAYDAAMAQYDLDVKTMSAKDATDLLRQRLEVLAITLDANSPLRQGLQGMIEELALLTGDYDVNVTKGEPGWSPWKPKRWGGIDNYTPMSAGGIRQAQMGSGRNRVWWDEPATGGEAYVPRLGDPARSLPVLATAAGWYGYSLGPSGGGTTIAQGAVQIVAPQNAPPSYVGAMADHMLGAAVNLRSP